MYICDNGHSFDEPVAPCVHNMSPYYYEACPECGNTDVSDARRCPECGEVSRTEDWQRVMTCAKGHKFMPDEVGVLKNDPEWGRIECCPECGKDEIGPADKCPECGFVEVED